MNRDFFDRIMDCKLFSPFFPFYKKHKEVLLYLFFGGLTFFLNLGCYALCARGFHWNPLISNIIAWIVGVLFAYMTNHIWVFKSTVHKASAVIKEMLFFCTGRLATLAMEELLLWLGINVLSINDLVVKLVAQIAVIIGNYLISKLVVFKKD